MDFSKVTGFFKKKAEPAQMADAQPMDFDNLNIPELPDFDNSSFNNDASAMPDLPEIDDKGYLSDIETERARQKKSMPDLPHLPWFKPAGRQTETPKKMELPPLPEFSRPDRMETRSMHDLPELPDLPDFDSATGPRMVSQEKSSSLRGFIRPETKLVNSPASAAFRMPSNELPLLSRETSYTKKDKNEIFTSINDFSKILDSIKSTRSLARKMDSDLSVMVESEAKKEKCFGQMHRIMEDTQRKLMLIDRALFEGGG